MPNDDPLHDVQAVFQGLRLSHWTEHNQQLKPGAQASVLVAKHTDGYLGVFRLLKPRDDTELRRFFREVKMLSAAQYRHPNILDLLDWTKDEVTPWYISRLGNSFKNWWHDYRLAHAAEPDLIVATATSVLLQLTDGLRNLHKAGIVHRDIKPTNIIVCKYGDTITPVLIDFGLVHIEGEERLTPPDMAMGNKQFSPDVVMRRMDRVPPWLDIFQLAQLLIWMVSKNTKPEWDRPLHWRWVNYDPKLPDATILALRAITALCSEEQIAPPDAGELHNLIKERFPSQTVDSAKGTIMRFDTSKIAAGIAAGKSAQDLVLAEDHSVVSAASVDADLFYSALRTKLRQLFETAIQQGVECHIVCDVAFSDVVTQLRSNPSAIEKTVFEVVCGEQNGRCFSFRVATVAYLPSLRKYMSDTVPSTSNLFAFFLQRFSNSSSRLPFPHRTNVATLERDGQFILRTEKMEQVSLITVDKLADLVKSWIEDPDPWAAIQRDR